MQGTGYTRCVSRGRPLAKMPFDSVVSRAVASEDAAVMVAVITTEPEVMSRVTVPWCDPWGGRRHEAEGMREDGGRRREERGARGEGGGRREERGARREEGGGRSGSSGREE